MTGYHSVLVVCVACLALSCAVSSPAARDSSPSPAPGDVAGVPAETSARDVTENTVSATVPSAASRVDYQSEVVDSAALSIPAGVGALDKAAKSAPVAVPLDVAFRDAYREALLRSIPLAGVLGGDFVHLWSVKSAFGQSSGGAAFAQNWRELELSVNAWGLPGLSLASCPQAGGRVCVIRGTMLNAYGMGGGIEGANGVAGYGAPLTDEFHFRIAEETGAAQRFERGLLFISDGGTRSFTPETPPSSFGVPDAVGQIADPSPELFPQTGTAAFREAWKAAVDSGSASDVPDGPVFFAGGQFIQTFGRERWAILLPIGKEFPYGYRAHSLVSPFYEKYRSAGGWDRSSAKYGAPLTDSFALGDRIAQRFTKGVMSVTIEAEE